MVKRQKEKLKAQKDLEQYEALFELKRAREREYYKVEEFLINLELNFVVPQVREIVINKWLLRNQFNTIGAIMALKHHGKCLSRKVMNKLKHALNRNTTLQAACIALAGTALTFLMRQNRTVVVDPIYEGGELTGARSSIAVPTIADLAEETAAADMAANTVGGNIATMITEIREANQAFQRTLATERETFLRTLQAERLTAAQNLETERRTHETNMRATAAERPRNPELKVEPPEFYEGDPAEIDTWLRRMTYYFGQVRLTNNDQHIAYAIQ